MDVGETPTVSSACGIGALPRQFASDLGHSLRPPSLPPADGGYSDSSSSRTTTTPRMAEGEATIQLVARQSASPHSTGQAAADRKPGRYFRYDAPLSEETGVWIPVSIPPMQEGEPGNGIEGACLDGGCFPDGCMGWDEFLRGERELTMWDVMVEMLLAARGKAVSLASGNALSRASADLLKQTWQEMARTLEDANFGNAKEMLDTEPPRWVADSSTSTCMLCGVRFHPILGPRHHCRFCGGVYCGDCSKGRSLLPPMFRTADPQRVCDVCGVRLHPLQPYLMDQVSRASRLPTQDVTDLSTLRSWMNFPWGQSMEHEIYKATNTLRGYSQVGMLKPEKSIPEKILRNAKGLAILTVAKVGVMVTYHVGTGLVLARREDGSWSPPSAIASFGIGWGAQGGGELTDFIIILRTEDAVKTFSGNAHFSVGAGASASAGIIGRTAKADFRAGDGGYATCYTYSCSKGAFAGCALEGSIVITRTSENSRFYGASSITAVDILLGSFPRPPAATILYHALHDLFQKLEH